MGIYDVIHKTGSTYHVTTPPEEDRATAIGNMLRKIGEDRTGSYEDVIADRQTHTHTTHTRTHARTRTRTRTHTHTHTHRQKDTLITILIVGVGVGIMPEIKNPLKHSGRFLPLNAK